VSIGRQFCPQNWLPLQLQIFIYGQSSTDLANFVKINPAELNGLTEITKYTFKKIKHQQNKIPPRLRFPQTAWANKILDKRRITGPHIHETNVLFPVHCHTIERL